MFKSIFASTLLIASINNTSSGSDSSNSQEQDNQFLHLRSEHEKNVTDISIILQQANALELRLAGLDVLRKNPSLNDQKNDFETELANIRQESESLRKQIESIRLQEQALEEILKQAK